MKHKLVPIILGLMLSMMLITTALAAYPIQHITMVVVDGTDSYFLTTLTEIPPGEEISDGTYLGWCVETCKNLPRGEDTKVTLYSSLYPPTDLAGEAWDMVNYILNHKQGGRIDIQAAIWYFIKLDPYWPTPGYYAYDPYGDNRYGGNPPSLATKAMVADAIANGVGYTPGPYDVLAIICVPEDATKQISIVELPPPPPPPPGFTPGFWKHNIGVYLGINKGSYSAFEGGPLDGTKVTPELLESLASTIGVSLSDAYRALTAKGPGSEAIRRNMANVFNHAAGYGDYIDG